MIRTETGTDTSGKPSKPSKHCIIFPPLPSMVGLHQTRAPPISPQSLLGTNPQKLYVELIYFGPIAGIHSHYIIISLTYLHKYSIHIVNYTTCLSPVIYVDASIKQHILLKKMQLNIEPYICIYTHTLYIYILYNHAYYIYIYLYTNIIYIYTYYIDIPHESPLCLAETPWEAPALAPKMPGRTCSCDKRWWHHRRRRRWKGDLGMGQYLLIPFLVG